VPDQDRKRRIVTAIQVRVLNPPIRALARHGLVPKVALLETTGRRSGQTRCTPVTNGLQRGTNTFWLVAEHGRSTAYVLNLEAEPRVRVRIKRRWRTGRAEVLPGEDSGARQKSLPWLHSATVRMMGTEHVVVRIDLDP